MCCIVIKLNYVRNFVSWSNLVNNCKVSLTTVMFYHCQSIDKNDQMSIVKYFFYHLFWYHNKYFKFTVVVLWQYVKKFKVYEFKALYVDQKDKWRQS